jgi:hypothetical protein
VNSEGSALQARVATAPDGVYTASNGGRLTVTRGRVDSLAAVPRRDELYLPAP